MDPAENQRYLNRELSWLDFNDRVLALAEDRRLPLLERVRFLSIASRNLDEFFQVRVADFHELWDAGLSQPTPDGRSPEQQLEAIRGGVLTQIENEERIGGKTLLDELAEHDIEILGWDELKKKERKEATRIFEDEIFPVVTPLAVDPAHPFPYVSNLSFNLAVMVRHPRVRDVRFARIKVPPLFPRFVPLEAGRRFLPIEELIAHHLEALFPGMEIVAKSFFRVTRDADLGLKESEEDLLVGIQSGLRRRDRRSDAVRLEVHESTTERALELLLAELELDSEDVYLRRGLLDLGDLAELCDLDRPDLKFAAWPPRVPSALKDLKDGGDIFEVLRRGDVLVHHPYDSFSRSVETLIAQAAEDPRVLAIKHTIYRTAQDTQNPLLAMLVKAAESGKQVVTLVELKARFDEQANIEWARRLEQAGAHVVYGIVGLKTHAKAVLVVRQEEDGIRRYCHIGTGNYNPHTARLYEDLGLLSASEAIGADLADLFNHLTGFSQHPDYRKLLVAPEGMRAALLRLIDDEAEQSDGHITLKCNALSDPTMIDALYRASQAGTKIDLIVRGICCLRPGVPGLSEHIRVRSVLGRYLEHSRIVRFGSERRGYRYWFGSADWMTRNLDKRVEVMVPIEDPDHQARLETILEALHSDDTLSWSLGPEGQWTRISGSQGLGAQSLLAEGTST